MTGALFFMGINSLLTLKFLWNSIEMKDKYRFMAKQRKLCDAKLKGLRKLFMVASCNKSIKHRTGL